MSASFLRSAFLLLLSLLAAGCNPAAGLVANQIFRAPNKRTHHGLEFTSDVQALAQRATFDSFDVGVKGASLRVALVGPGRYELLWQPRIDGPNVWVETPMALQMERKGTPARGLILTLHGFGSCKEQMLPWAVELANEGYYVAMVDLRGHGASTGEWVGFGALEKRDLSQVLDELERRGYRDLPIGVLGVSYGASIGLAFAAEDPRVRSVIAFSPFASAEAGIPELARAAFPDHAARISDRLFRAAFRLGAVRGGFDWAATDVLPSMEKLDRPVLFVHGAADTWLRPEHSRRLHSSAVPGSRLVLVEDETHVSLPLQLAKIASEIRAWFEAELADNAQGAQVAQADTDIPASL